MPNELDWAARCRRATYRAWRRGTRELDLLLGPFASAWLDPARSAPSETELRLFEAFLDEKDTDIYRWIMGEEHATYEVLLKKIRAGAGKGDHKKNADKK